MCEEEDIPMRMLCQGKDRAHRNHLHHHSHAFDPSTTWWMNLVHGPLIKTCIRQLPVPICLRWILWWGVCLGRWALTLQPTHHHRRFYLHFSFNIPICRSQTPRLEYHHLHFSFNILIHWSLTLRLEYHHRIWRRTRIFEGSLRFNLLFLFSCYFLFYALSPYVSCHVILSLLSCIVIISVESCALRTLHISNMDRG